MKAVIWVVIEHINLAMKWLVYRKKRMQLRNMSTWSNGKHETKCMKIIHYQRKAEIFIGKDSCTYIFDGKKMLKRRSNDNRIRIT